MAVESPISAKEQISEVKKEAASKIRNLIQVRLHEVEDFPQSEFGVYDPSVTGKAKGNAQLQPGIWLNILECWRNPRENIPIVLTPKGLFRTDFNFFIDIKHHVPILFPSLEKLEEPSTDDFLNYGDLAVNQLEAKIAQNQKTSK